MSEGNGSFKARVAAVIQIMSLISFVGLLAVDAYLHAVDIPPYYLLGLLGMAWGARPDVFFNLIGGIRLVRKEENNGSPNEHN